MEVHQAKNPTHKKRWVEYLLEFFMLFFALSLGFFAENIREASIEDQRANELAKSLQTDIKDDIEKFNEFVKLRKQLELNFETYINEIEKNGLQKDNQLQYALLATAIFNWKFFEPQTANLDQIISSGALRYFKDAELVTQISVIKTAMSSLMTRQEREKLIFSEYLTRIMANNFNFKPYDIYFEKQKNKEEINHIVFLQKIKTGEILLNDEDLVFVDSDNIDFQKQLVNKLRFFRFAINASEFVTYQPYQAELEKLLIILEKHNEQH